MDRRADEMLETTGVIDVQVTEADRFDLVETDAGERKRLFKRLTLAGQYDGVGGVAVETSAQSGVADQGGVEAGVQQHPATVAQQQDARDRTHQHLVRRRSLERDRLGQVLPTEREQDDLAYPGSLAAHGFSLS